MRGYYATILGTIRKLSDISSSVKQNNSQCRLTIFFYLNYIFGSIMFNHDDLPSAALPGLYWVSPNSPGETIRDHFSLYQAAATAWEHQPSDPSSVHPARQLLTFLHWAGGGVQDTGIQGVLTWRYHEWGMFTCTKITLYLFHLGNTFHSGTPLQSLPI